MWVVAVPVYHCYLSNAIALPPLVGKPSGGRASQTYLDPLSKFQASTTRLFFLTNAAVRALHGFIQCSAANSCLNSELVKFSHSSVPEHLQSSHLRFSLSPLQLPSVPLVPNMAKRTLPLLFINLGGEMMYILDQRLTAQAIEPDKASKVMRMKGKVVNFC